MEDVALRIRRKQRRNLPLALGVEVSMEGRPKQLHPALKPQPLASIIQLRNQFRLHPQRQHLAVLGLTSAALTRPDRDLALFGLANLPDEVGARFAFRGPLNRGDVPIAQFFHGELTQRRLCGLSWLLKPSGL